MESAIEKNEPIINRRPDGFLIVGIGASAGGIQALKVFFQHLPVDSGLACVVILHLSPDHDSQLAHVLQTVTNITVSQVTEKVKIEPNHIYVVSPNQHLIMEEDFIAPSVNIHLQERRAPVDIFFRTLADSHGPRAICVVLSGTGANGSMGLKRIKERGGVAYVQNPREAEFNEMPRNSIATELVDEVLPVADIPASIIAYRNSLGSVQITVEPGKRPEQQQQALREIFSELRIRTGHDFSNYKLATLLRRIERRINIRNLTDLSAYAALIKQNPDETTALLKDLLISVTNFFRDSKPFQSLELDVTPAILNNKNSNDQVRIWVAGCATGEEAYSIAMLLAEKTLNAVDAPPVQIFATDIDEAAIAVAREGYYTLNDAADVSEERLRRFFNKEGDGFRVRREIREMVLFANHNFLKDPPFSHLDLITCRNVLIYLNHTAQERVMETFHFALEPGGFLFLGSSESVDGAGDLYATFNRESHLFQARKVTNRNYPMPESVPRAMFPKNRPMPAADEKDTSSLARSSFRELHQKLLEEYAPPSVVINEDYEILHMSEKVGRYFEFSGGEPTQNLLKVVLPEIRLELRTALYQAVQRQTAVEARNLKYYVEGKAYSINLHIRPVLNTNSTAKGFILVIFEPNEEVQDAMPVMVFSEEVVAKQLEEQLTAVNEQLRQSNEQHEFQAEELKAANEELQAMNEELRSAAEELETSKEELQSINEELRTVNQELKVKIDEISITSNNLQNLINSADVGTIFLDRGFRTRLFTPAVRQIFNLIPTDYGRPISDITNKLQYSNLLQDAETVLEKLIVVEREVTTGDNQYYMMRLLPYRTSEDRINGVVITFFDITRQKQAEQALRKSEEHLRLLIESANDYAIFSLDINRCVISWSNGAEAILGYTEQEIIGQSVDIIFTPEDRANGVPEAEAETAAQKGRAINERLHIRKDGSRFWGSGSSSSLRDSNGSLLGFVKIMRDLTESKQAEEALRDSEERFRSLVIASSDSVYRMSADWKMMYILEGKHFLAENASANGSWLENYIPEQSRPAVKKAIEEVINSKGIFELEHEVFDVEGNISWAYSRAVPKLGKDGDIIEWMGAISNITQRKKAEEALRISEKRFRTLTDSVPQVMWSNDAEGRANYFNQRWYDYSGLTNKESFGVGWEAIVHPDDTAASIRKWQEAKAKGEIFDTEFRLRNAVGKYCWFVGRNVPLKDDSGKITGWFGSATDIDNLKNAEEAVRNTADRLHMALEAGNLGTYEYDFETGTYLSSAQHKANFGFREDEPVSLEGLKERILPADRPYMENPFEKGQNKNSVYSSEYRTMLPNGDVRWIRSVGRFVYSDKGQPKKMIGITLNVTEEKMFTEELSKQVKERTTQLQQSNNDLQQFAHVASHDLKEPVRKIKTFNMRVLDEFGGQLPEKVQNYLTKIDSAADRMYAMIEGVLEYSKLGNLAQSTQLVDLNKILQNIKTDLEVMIDRKKAVITATELPTVTANDTSMYQLFYNLILNSLKFSKADEDSRINITSTVVTKDQKKFVKVVLSDNGIGFEQEYAHTIFDTFTRLNSLDKYEGTGLGLALCKKIVERYGGSIQATGELGNGASFTILLPLS